MERGKSNSDEILQWISKDWLNTNDIYLSSVCFLQGFPGVGKTRLALGLNNIIKQQSDWDSIWLDIPIRDQKINPVYSLLSDLSSWLNAKGRNNLSTALKNNEREDIALLRDLSQPILIVIDDIQYAFTEESNKPLEKLQQILSTIAKNTGHLGKILLLSNRVVEDDVLEHFDSWTLLPLKPDEAKKLLQEELIKRQINEELPEEIQEKFVDWLGYNPRAIITLASTLKYSSSEELIDIKTEIWKSRDHQIKDEDLLEKLEEKLLEKILASLDLETNDFLKQLSVYRKPFGEEAMKAIVSENKSHAKKKKDLINRFLMERHTHNIKQFYLHPIARDIALRYLEENDKALKQAHILASDYYNRFKGKIIAGNNSEKLGSYFIETCYHLYQANQQERLGKITAKYAEYQITNFKNNKNNKNLYINKNQLNKQINVLSAISEFLDFDDERIEFQLASALIDRKEKGDIENALIHAKRATIFGTLYKTWKLRIDLELKINGIEETIKVARQGLEKIAEDNILKFANDYISLVLQISPENKSEMIVLLKEAIQVIPGKYTYVLYECCAELLAKQDTNQAIAFLKEGIKEAPYSYSLYIKRAELLAIENREKAIAILRQDVKKNPKIQNLYDKCVQFLLEEKNKQGAIALLQQGIQHIPDNPKLYLHCALLLAEENRIEAITLLQQAIQHIPDNPELYLHCALLLAEENRIEAITLLQQAIQHIPNNPDLYKRYALLLAEENRIEAITLLQQGLQHIPNNPDLYLHCALLLAEENKIEAITLLQKAIQHIPDNSKLYLHCALLLAEENRIEAITLLQQGLQHIPNNLELYGSLSWILFRENQISEAIEVLNKAIVVITENDSFRNSTAQKIMSYYFALQDSQMLNNFLQNTTNLNNQSLSYGRVLQLELQKKWQEAGEVAHEINLENSHSELLRQEAFSWFCAGEIQKAEEIVQNIVIKEKSTSGWLKAFIALKNGDQKLAEECITAYLDRPLQDSEEVNEKFLLYLWDISVDSDKGINVAFCFPTLPPSITGLDKPITRLQHGDRILPNILNQKSQNKDNHQPENTISESSQPISMSSSIPSTDSNLPSQPTTKIIKIFLASSSELKDDRDQFEQFIYRETSNKYIEQGIFLRLVIWENFIDTMSKTRLQDEYNKAIKECDIFVSLFFTKVGKYTEEEFETAFKTFQENDKPKIYTYFKKAQVDISEMREEQIMSLLNFKKKLSDLGHFFTQYSDINDLKYQFSQQLPKIL